MVELRAENEELRTIIEGQKESNKNLKKERTQLFERLETLKIGVPSPIVKNDKSAPAPIVKTDSKNDSNLQAEIDGLNIQLQMKEETI